MASIGCPYCGKLNSDQRSHCYTCGTDLSEKPKRQSARTQDNRSSQVHRRYATQSNPDCSASPQSESNYRVQITQLRHEVQRLQQALQQAEMARQQEEFRRRRAEEDVRQQKLRTPTARQSDPYAVLEIQPNASLQVIQEAYHLMSNVWHPDRFPQDSKTWRLANEKMKAINWAYAQLKKHLKHPTAKGT